MSEAYLVDVSIVTWSGVLYHVEWMRSYHRITREKQVTDVSLVLKDSDTESENLSSLIRFSVSDRQKTDSSKDVSF